MLIPVSFALHISTLFCNPARYRDAYCTALVAKPHALEYLSPRMLCMQMCISTETKKYLPSAFTLDRRVLTLVIQYFLCMPEPCGV